MRVGKSVMLLSMLTACTLASAPRPKDARKADDPPRGDWAVEKVEENGILAYSKTKLSVEKTVRVSPTKWAVLVDWTDRPIREWAAAYYQNGTVHEIDFFPDEPKRLRKGIWKLVGEVLSVCYGEAGGERPTDFTAGKGSGRTLFIMKRLGKE